VATSDAEPDVVADTNFPTRMSQDDSEDDGSLFREVDALMRSSKSMTNPRNSVLPKERNQSEAVPVDNKLIPKARPASCIEAVLANCPRAQLNLLLGVSSVPKPVLSTKTYQKGPKGCLTRFVLSKAPDLSKTSEIKDLAREIASLTKEIDGIKANHKTCLDQASAQRRHTDETVVSLLEQILAEKDPLEETLQKKKDELDALKKSLPKPVGLSRDELMKYSEIMDSKKNPHVVDKISKPFFKTIAFLQRSHEALKRPKPKSLDGSKASEAVDAVAAVAAVAAGDGKKSSKDGPKFPTVTVYPDMGIVPEKIPALARSDVLLSDDVDSLSMLFEVLNSVPGFTRIFSIFTEVKERVEDPQKLKRFIQFTKAMGCDDDFPSDEDLRKALLYIIEAVEYYKNATSYAKLSLDDALSKKHFREVFVDAKPVFKKPFTFTRARPQDFFASECRFACAAGGGPAQENIEIVMRKYHESMQSTSGSRPLATIGIQSIFVDQHPFLMAIKDHKSFTESGMKITEFLERNRVIHISEDDKGTKYFNVLPLPADDE